MALLVLLLLLLPLLLLLSTPLFVAPGLTRTITGDTLTSAATISIYLYPTYNYIHNIHENDNHIFSLLLTLVQPNLAINNW